MTPQANIDEQQVEYELFRIDFFQSELDRYAEMEDDMEGEDV